MTKQQEITELKMELLKRDRKIEELEQIVFNAAFAMDEHATKLFKSIGQPTD